MANRTNCFRSAMIASALIILSTFAPASCLAQGYSITTVTGGGDASALPLVGATSVAVDSAGNLYVAVDNTLSKFITEVSSDGTISIIGGSLTSMSGYSGDGGPATSAQFNFNFENSPGIAVDSAGNLYIADTGNIRVRRISPDGTITTVAGGGSPSFSTIGASGSFGDGGPATAAVLTQPEGLAVDSSGNLYIADTVIGRIRKVSTDGTITTVAGCSGSPQCSFTLGDGGPATSAMLSMPSAVAVDSGGNLYIADTANNRIRMVSTDGTITTVAGSGAGSFQGDGGPAAKAGLYMPSGVAVDSAGNIFIDDAGDYRIRMVTPDGTITTIAGNGASRQASDSANDGGPAASAKLSRFTSGLALGAGGTIYFADYPFGVRLLTPN